MGRIRREKSVFRKGYFSPVSSMLGCIAYRRHDENGNIMVIVNRNEHSISYRLPYDFEKSFAAYQDYDSNLSLDSVEAQLVDEIVEILVEDIFNATVANW